MAIGIVMASWTSGWHGSRVLVQAAVALMAGAVALGLGGKAFDVLVDEYLPALVLAVGVAGAVAIRPSSRRAVTARLVVLAIFVVLAIGVPSAGVVILLTVLALPAMGAVESAVAHDRARVKRLNQESELPCRRHHADLVIRCFVRMRGLRSCF